MSLTVDYVWLILLKRHLRSSSRRRRKLFRSPHDLADLSSSPSRQGHATTKPNSEEHLLDQTPVELATGYHCAFLIPLTLTLGNLEGVIQCCGSIRCNFSEEGSSSCGLSHVSDILNFWILTTWTNNFSEDSEQVSPPSARPSSPTAPARIR